MNTSILALLSLGKTGASFLRKYLRKWKSLWTVYTRGAEEVNNPFSDLTEDEIDQILQPFSSYPQHARILRGVGFCNTPSCSRHRHHTHLYQHEGPFICCVCNQQGWAVPERGLRIGPRGRLYGEVRIVYSFNVLTRKHEKIAVVRDEAIAEKTNTYIYESSNIYTDKSALETAEKLLNVINQDLSIGDDEFTIPVIQETVLSFDEPREDFVNRLETWAYGVGQNKFLKREIVSTFSEDQIPNSGRIKSGGP